MSSGPTQDTTWIRGEILRATAIPEQYELSVHVMWEGKEVTKVAVGWSESNDSLQEWFSGNGIFLDGGDAFELLARIPEDNVLEYVRLAVTGILSKGEALADVYRQETHYEDIHQFIELCWKNLDQDTQDRLLQLLIACARQLDLDSASLAELQQKGCSIFQEWESVQAYWVNEALNCSVTAQQALGLLSSLLNSLSPRSTYRVLGNQIWNHMPISQNLELVGEMLGLHGSARPEYWNEAALQDLSQAFHRKVAGVDFDLLKLPSLLPPRLNLPFDFLAHLSAADWVGFQGWKQQVDAKWSSPSDWNADTFPLIWARLFSISQPPLSEAVSKVFIRRAIDTIKAKPHIDLLVLSLVVLWILIPRKGSIPACKSAVVVLLWITEGGIPANAHEILVDLLASLSRVVQDTNDLHVLFLLTGPFDLTAPKTADGADCDRMWEAYLRPSPANLVTRPMELAQPLLRGIWIERSSSPHVPGFHLVRQIGWFQEVAFAPEYLDEFQLHGGVLTEESLPTQNAVDEIAPILSQAMNGIIQNNPECQGINIFLRRYHIHSRACLEWVEVLRIFSQLLPPARARYLQYLVVAVAYLEHGETSLEILREAAGSQLFTSDPITAKEVSGLMIDRELSQRAHLLVSMLRLIGISSSVNLPHDCTIGRMYMLLDVSLGIKDPGQFQLKTPEEIWQIVKSCKAFGDTVGCLQAESIEPLIHKVRYALPLPTTLKMPPSVLSSLTYNDISRFEGYRNRTLNQCLFSIGSDSALFLLWLSIYKPMVLNSEDSLLVELKGKFRHRVLHGKRLEDALLYLLALSCLSRGVTNPTCNSPLKNFEDLLRGKQVSNSQEIISLMVSSMASILTEPSSTRILLFFQQHAKIGPSDPSAVQFWKHFASCRDFATALKLTNPSTEADWIIVHRLA